MWLTRFSIRRPIVVASFFIALAAFGAISFGRLGRSLNPNVTFPIVVVSADYPGASPAEMERLVIKPIDRAHREGGGRARRAAQRVEIPGCGDRAHRHQPHGQVG